MCQNCDLSVHYLSSDQKTNIIGGESIQYRKTHQHQSCLKDSEIPSQELQNQGIHHFFEIPEKK
jgi:hypothetical protein